MGLNGTVVKSHGSADATGVAAAIKLGFTLSQTGFSEKLAARVASVATPVQGSAQSQGDDAEAGDKNDNTDSK